MATGVTVGVALGLGEGVGETEAGTADGVGVGSDLLLNRFASLTDSTVQEKVISSEAFLLSTIVKPRVFLFTIK